MKRKRLLSLFLGLMLAVALLGGCKEKTDRLPSEETGKKDNAETEQKTDTSKDEETEAQTGNQTQETEWSWPLAEKKELSYWIGWNNSYVENPGDLTAIKALEEQTNVHINWIAVSDQEASEKFGLMLASGDWPDMVQGAANRYTGGLVQAVEDGLFYDLTEYVEEYMPVYHDLRQYNDRVLCDTVTDDGRILACYTLKSTLEELTGESVWAGLVIRQDWLDECGLEVPETVEEWENVLVAFKERYHIYPLMLGDPSGIDRYGAFLTAYGVLNEFYQEDGVVKYGPMEEGYKDYLMQTNRWYEMGLIDPNFSSVAFEWISPELISGTYGAGTILHLMVADAPVSAGYDVPENYYLTPVTNPVLKKGDPVHGVLTGRESIVFGKETSVTTKCQDLELACRWLDYMYTEEAMRLTSMGIEGETYLDNGDGTYSVGPVIQEQLEKKEYPSLQDALSTHVLFTHGFNRFNFNALQYLDPSASANSNLAYQAWDQNLADLSISSYVTMTSDETVASASVYTDIQTLVQEGTVQFITGARSFDEYDQFVDQMKKYGIEDCIRYRQAALDRYFAR